MTHYSRFVFTALITAFFGGIVSGNEAEADKAPDGGDIELPAETIYGTGSAAAEPVDVADTFRIPLTTDEAPLQVHTISNDLNRRQGNRSLRDTLRYSPGITTSMANGIHDFFVIRGIDSLTGGLVLMDRVPEPEATLYPMYNIEKVQVAKGPTSFLFGAGATAGSVNLVRKVPHYETFGQIDLAAGTFDTYRQSVDVNLGDPEQPLAFRMNGLSETSNGYRDGKNNETYGVNPSFRYKLNEQETVTLQLDYLKSRAKPDSGLPVVGTRVVNVPRTRSFQQQNDFSDQEVFRIQLDYENKVSESTTFRNKLYYTDFEWDTRGVIFAGIDVFGVGASTTLSRFQPFLRDEQMIFGDQVELEHHFETGDIAHVLTTGLEFTRYTDEFTLAIPATTDIDIHTLAQAANPFLPGQPSNTADASTDWYSLYAVDQMTLSEELTVLAGGRFDYMDFNDSANSLSRSDALFNPFGGLVYRLGPTLAWFANAGIAHAPPSSIQRTGGAGKPERSEQVETGLKGQTTDGKIQVQASVFELNREDVPIAADATGVLNDTGDQKTCGVELELTAKPTEPWQIIVAYAHLDSELEDFSESLGGFVFDRSGMDAPYVPENMVQVWTDYTLSSGWGCGAGVRWLDEQFIAPSNVFKIDSYVVIDSTLFYRQPRWEASLNFYNLTNEDYNTRAGSVGNAVLPGDGVNMIGRLTLKF